MEESEECDDGNVADGDGCTGCRISELALSERFGSDVATGDRLAHPAVAMGPDGRFVVGWLQSTLPDSPWLMSAVSARRFDGSDLPVEAPFGVSQIPNQKDGLAVAVDSAGNMVLVWSACVEGAECWLGANIYGQRIGADGVVRGGLPW